MKASHNSRPALRRGSRYRRSCWQCLPMQPTWSSRSRRLRSPPHRWTLHQSLPGPVPMRVLQFGYGFGGRVNSANDRRHRQRRLAMAARLPATNMQNDMFVFTVSRVTSTTAASRVRQPVFADFAHQHRRFAARPRRVAVYRRHFFFPALRHGWFAAQRLTVSPYATTGDQAGLSSASPPVQASMLRLTDHVFGRVEYRYTHYGDRNFDFGTGYRVGQLARSPRRRWPWREVLRISRSKTRKAGPSARPFLFRSARDRRHARGVQRTGSRRPRPPGARPRPAPRARPPAPHRPTRLPRAPP